MSIEFIWQLPTSANRGGYFDYVHQVARAADLSGFDGIQIQNDPEGDEPWIVAGYLARSTRHVRLLTEFDASRGSAVYAAKNAVSYQRYSGGRFAWQIGTGGTQELRRRQGDFVADTDVLPRIEEFITVARGVLTSESYSFKGQFFEVLNGGFKGPLSNSPVPRIYLSGNTTDAYQLSARVADVHVFDALPLEQLEIEIRKLEDITQNRPLHLGVRLALLARETEAEARADAAQNASNALVGSYEQVAAALLSYVKVGIGSFILTASPHLEEAYRVGEHVLPVLRKQVR